MTHRIPSRKRNAAPAPDKSERPAGNAGKSPAAVGNQQLQRALGGGRGKLNVSHPGDHDEQQADRTADAFVGDQKIHRQCDSCSDDGTVKRKAAGGEKGGTGGKPAPGGKEAPGAMAGKSAAPAGLKKSASPQPLAGPTRARMENFFGADLSGVRLHNDRGAHAQAAALNARAFTQGQDIWLGRNAGVGDERLLAHEVAHVVQEQKGADPAAAGDGRVRREFELCEDPAEIAKELLPLHGFGPPDKSGKGGPAPPEVETVTVSAADFQSATGVDGNTLPDSTFVGMDQVETMAPGGEQALDKLAEQAMTSVAPAAAMAPTAMSMIPPNSIGILWGAGHQTLFANVEGSLTMRGYRANLFWHAGESLPGPAGRWFTEQLIRGKPGGFRGDLPFLLSGDQSVIFLETDPTTARDFATELVGKEYGGDYRFSPPRPDAKPGSTEQGMYERVYGARGAPRAVLCANNCITVPLAETEAVLGTHPTVSTPKGPLDLATGRYPDGTYAPHEHGRARLMKEYMKDPDLSKGRPGLRSIQTTLWGGRALGAIRVGGTIMLVVGLYRTGRRLKDAYGTDDFPLVVADEAFTWGGMIAGAAIATAATSALICAPAGPVTFVCAAGGFLAGLIGGTIGAALGSMVIPLVVRYVQALAELGHLMLGALEGLEMIGKAGRGLTTHMFFVGPMAARLSISPCNWEWIALPNSIRGDINLMGFLMWARLGNGDINHFLGNVGNPIGSYPIPPEMLQRIARAITALLSLRSGAASVITAQEIAKMTPVQFARFLNENDMLRYRYDPYNLAELMFQE